MQNTKENPIILIGKKALDYQQFQRPYRLFLNARSAFKNFLSTINLKRGEKILLPAYVGWSEQEGSGVFDPIEELKLSYDFYNIDSQLHIDIENLKKQLSGNKIKVLVIIHYFGYIDPSYKLAVSLAREKGTLVVEDEAHAMLSDLFGGGCGRLADATIFSLHKLLPVEKGGMLIFNSHSQIGSYLTKDSFLKEITLPWQFDLFHISQKRREHTKILERLIAPLNEKIVPLRTPLEEGIVPQTFPVLIKNGGRDYLYFMLNNAGFGVVSLYHNLIEQIPKNKYPLSYGLSEEILNLPVHQDCTKDLLGQMVDTIANLLDNF